MTQSIILTFLHSSPSTMQCLLGMLLLWGEFYRWCLHQLSQYLGTLIYCFLRLESWLLLIYVAYNMHPYKSKASLILELSFLINLTMLQELVDCSSLLILLVPIRLPSKLSVWDSRLESPSYNYFCGIILYALNSPWYSKMSKWRRL